VWRHRNATAFSLMHNSIIDTLQDPAVRDLAWVIGSPGLLAAEYPAYQNQVVNDAWCNAQLHAGAAWLARLDLAPQPLHDFIAARPTRRLGHYFESMVKFWLLQMPDTHLVATNLQVKDKQRTLGEYDFLFRYASATLCHWETAVKFYLQQEPLAEQRTFIGPGTRDRLDLKLNKVFQQQLQLSRTPAGRQALPQEFPPEKAQAFIKGYLFYHASSPNQLPVRGVSAAHLCGWWARHAIEALPQTSAASRWVVLPRLRWLAPVRLASIHLASDQLATETAVMNLSQLNLMLSQHFCLSKEALLICELAGSEGGEWHEISRGFVVCDTWPVLTPYSNSQ